jgi:DNA-binding PadR family transcriptional regulator
MGRAMTNGELAILSLVAEEPRHGYQIEQVIQDRGMREWTEIGFSSIYYLLKKLEQQGLIEGELQEVERGPARKVYHITPAGGEALRVAVRAALSEPQPCYPPLQLGLANLPCIPIGEAIMALHQYRAALSARLDHIRSRWKSQHPLPYFVDAMFQHSTALIEAELSWIDDFIRNMNGEARSD